MGKSGAIGKLVQVIGPVVDVEFALADLPDIYDALEIQLDGGGKLVCEVQGQSGHSWVRSVAMSSTDGLRRGWEVVKANIGSYILLWLVLVLGLGIVAGVVIGLPFLFVVAPAAIGLIAGTENAVTGGLVFAGVCLACYLPVAIVLNGILRSFTGTAWTLAFMRLTNQPKAPELEVFPS